MSPLQLEIVQIDHLTAINLNKIWHSRLPEIKKINVLMNKNKICFGAIYKNIWYACAIWTDPVARIFNHKNYLELRRMAIAQDAPKNTASRMLSIMTKIIKKQIPEIVNLISYQDSEVHSGTIYKASGWTKTSEGCKPGWGRGGKKYGRVAFNSYPISLAPKIRWEKRVRNEQEIKRKIEAKNIKVERKQLNLF